MGLSLENHGNLIIKKAIQINNNYTSIFDGNNTPTITTYISSLSNYGSINSNNIILGNNTKINVNLLNTDNNLIHNNDEFAILSTMGTFSGDYSIAVQDSETLSFTDRIVGDKSLVLKASRRSFGEILLNSKNYNLALILDEFISSDINSNIISSLDSLLGSAFMSAIEELNPVQGSLYNLLSNTSNQTSSTIQSHIYARMNNIDNNSLDGGLLVYNDYNNIFGNNILIANDSYSNNTNPVSFINNNEVDANINNGIWGKVSFKEIKHGIVGDDEGYNAYTYNLTLGKDFNIMEDKSIKSKLDIGMAFSYSATKVEGSNNSYNTDINSYQLSLYTNYIKDKWYINGLIGYALNQYDNDRNITYLNQTANSKFNANQYTAMASAGYNL